MEPKGYNLTYNFICLHWMYAEMMSSFCQMLMFTNINWKWKVKLLPCSFTQKKEVYGVSTFGFFFFFCFHVLAVCKDVQTFGAGSSDSGWIQTRDDIWKLHPPCVSFERWVLAACSLFVLDSLLAATSQCITEWSWFYSLFLLPFEWHSHRRNGRPTFPLRVTNGI